MSEFPAELSRTLCFGVWVAVGMVAGSVLVALVVLAGLKSPADAPQPGKE